MGRVLLIDDDINVLRTLHEVLLERGHETIRATSGEEGLTKLDGIDAVVTDLAMPGMDGLEVLKQIRIKDESLPVTMLTAQGSERIAVEATRAGAYDYLTKPFDIDEVVIVVERALEARRLRVENRRMSIERALGFRMIGESPPMKRLLEAVGRVATKDVTVLLNGETGTGKELVASLLHAGSKRADKPLVRFNCAAIPGELADAELFGHAKGAFTGATSSREGYFVQAHRGTLVLDEVAELPPAIQPKLLRALQEGEVQTIGSPKLEKVDVRVIASTHRDLSEEVKAGRFREDLYYRLAVVELKVPALRDRREDIPALATEFARKYGDKFGAPAVRLSPLLIDELLRADWPGNVRQLENAIARMVALAAGPEIGVDAFGAKTAPASSEATSDEGMSLKEQVEAFERGVLLRAYEGANRNQSETARRLGVSRVTIIDKLKRYGITS